MFTGHGLDGWRRRRRGEDGVGGSISFVIAKHINDELDGVSLEDALGLGC
jgi:hypothetical protein